MRGGTCVHVPSGVLQRHSAKRTRKCKPTVNNSVGLQVLVGPAIDVTCYSGQVVGLGVVGEWAEHGSGPCDYYVEWAAGSMEDFWLFYMKQHSKPATRRWHFAGTLSSILCLIYAVLFNWCFLFFAPLFGYGLAWYSHFYVEENMPATFGHPIWSLLCDFKMFFFMITGQMDREIKRLGTEATATRRFGRFAILGRGPMLRVYGSGRDPLSDSPGRGARKEPNRVNLDRDIVVGIRKCKPTVKNSVGLQVLVGPAIDVTCYSGQVVGLGVVGEWAEHGSGHGDYYVEWATGSLEEFWLFYMKQHSKPATRRWHFAGTVSSILCLIYAVLFNWCFLFFAPLFGYGLAWYSHFYVEKNMPATFGHPIWSLLCDFKMFFFMITGQMDREIKRLGTEGEGPAAADSSATGSHID
uniref:L-rhamnose-proton symporter like n=1 Tax=Tanacetum cinerariifolium TaxID=118510 RepID=A0A6L2KQI1_TANCI|nr:L-rhamnose-proton symporter like [Tanacetum cinerariifolium]